MAYRPLQKTGKQTFPLSDYLRVVAMAAVILVTLAALKIGNYFSTSDNRRQKSIAVGSPPLTDSGEAST
jgi:hypothetical protein